MEQKYPYKVQIVNTVWKEGKWSPGEPLAEYTFWAVSLTGAQRAASQWYNKQKTDPFEKFGGAGIGAGDWEFTDMSLHKLVRLAPSHTEALVLTIIG